MDSELRQEIERRIAHLMRDKIVLQLDAAGYTDAARCAECVPWDADAIRKPPDDCLPGCGVGEIPHNKPDGCVPPPTDTMTPTEYQEVPTYSGQGKTHFYGDGCPEEHGKPQESDLCPYHDMGRDVYPKSCTCKPPGEPPRRCPGCNSVQPSRRFGLCVDSPDAFHTTKPPQPERCGTCGSDDPKYLEAPCMFVDTKPDPFHDCPQQQQKQQQGKESDDDGA